MEQAADQLLLDFLSRVAAASQQHLPPRRRTEYIAEVRKRIESERDQAKVTTAAEMTRLLERIGPAEKLVAADLSPGDHAQEAEAPARPASGRRKLGLLVRPVSYERAPPPWRGGPRQTRLYRRKHKNSRPAEPPPGTAPIEGVLGRMSPGVILVRVLHGARDHPLAVGSAIVYLLAGLIGYLTALWPLAAVQVAFGRPWRRRDKWVALGIPAAITIISMAFWSGEANYIDEMIRDSFLEAGVLSLRIAIVGCAFYLLVALSRIVTAERARAGHFPVTGDTPFGSPPGDSAQEGG